MNFASINAKIKAMRGNLLPYAIFESLCRMDNVEQTARALTGYTPYANVLARFSGGEVHRGMLEQYLIFSLSEEFMRIYRFISDFNIRKYMRAFFLDFELSIIKTLFCTVFDERDISYSAPDLNLLFGKDMNIDASNLISSRDLGEFIQSLRGTELYSMLSDRITSDSTLFDIEMQIDLYYYMNLWRRQRQHLDTKNRGIMERIKGVEIDMRNIMLVWRLKKYYGMDDNLVYAYLIPIHGRLSRAKLVRMVNCLSSADVEKEIEDSPYGRVFGAMEDIERSFYMEMSRVYRHIERSNPNSLATIASYVFHKTLEIRNITSLLEGVRYKLTADEIMQYLYLPDKVDSERKEAP
ncbi:MAG: V-type ATPase subunit [Clostridiales bacterium]|jgi:V/A-type H+-transporting ATPase subunit C|nr:V-type ATPase subunit [Clostridiales bacterium]